MSEERLNTRLGCVENVPAHQVGQGPPFRDTVVFQYCIVLYTDIVNDRGQGRISRTILVFKTNKYTTEGTTKWQRCIVGGNNVNSFVRSKIAPMFTPGLLMKTYINFLVFVFFFVFLFFLQKRQSIQRKPLTA